MGEWRVDRFREEGPEGQKGAAGPGRAEAGTARTRRKPVSEGRWMCARRGACARTEGCAWRRGRVPAGAPGLGPETAAPLSRTQTPSRSSAGGSRASRSPRGPGPPSSPEAGPGERVAEGARPVTQPSLTNVSGRGRRAGYSRAPSPVLVTIPSPISLPQPGLLFPCGFRPLCLFCFSWLLNSLWTVYFLLLPCFLGLIWCCGFIFQP